MNSNGLQRCYKAIDECARQRMHSFAFAEAQVVFEKDIQLKLQLLGYRAWFVSSDLKQNVNGETYAVGGLVIAVRLDIHAYCLLSPNELQQWREAENRFLGVGGWQGIIGIMRFCFLPTGMHVKTILFIICAQHPPFHFLVARARPA
jgi:hypothetical protein